MKTRIIAEVAQGYEGRPDYCDLYVRAAAKAGAAAVKFQIVYADDTAEPGYEHYAFFKQLEMDVEIWQRVKARAEEMGILLFTDISGDRAMKIAETIRPDGIKIHSSNFFNRSLIRRAFEVSDRVFVSLGGVEEDEVRHLVDEIESWGFRDRLGLLFGFQSEPTPIEKSKLAGLPILRDLFPGIEIGYMDHAPGESDDQIHISLMAMTLGVDWIEKHLTLSRYLEIEDCVSALEPKEFADYVATLTRLSAAFGTAEPSLSEAERAYRDKSVKKLVAAQSIEAGRSITLKDIGFKRSPRIPSFQGFHDPRAILGRRLVKPLEAGAAILEENLA